MPGSNLNQTSVHCSQVHCSQANLQTDLQSACKQKIYEKFKEAELIWANELTYQPLIRPTVGFTKRGKVAGVASYRDNHINLNMVLLTENAEEFINTTVVHELAHLIAYQVYGSAGTGHSRVWKDVYIRLGGNGETYHNYDTTNSTVRKVKKYRYFCDCMEHELTSIRHKKIFDGAEYYCKQCKVELIHIP